MLKYPINKYGLNEQVNSTIFQNTYIEHFLYINTVPGSGKMVHKADNGPALTELTL